VGELGNRRDHVVRRGIDRLGGAELPGKLASLGCDVDHVARAGCRIGKLSELQLAISEKHDAATAAQ